MRRRPADHVAAYAHLREENALAVSARGGSGLALRGEPSSEVVGALGDDADAHPGMLDAAELRALALVRTGAARNEAKGVDRAGDHVSLAAELGHPEAMDDVLGPQLELDDRADRHMHLVRGRHPRVPELPPPLMRRRLDAQAGCRAGERDLRERPERQREDHREDDGRRRGPRDLEASVAIEAPRDLHARRAVAPHRVHERALDADEDKERDRADDEPQRSDRLGRRSHVFGAYGWKRRTQTMARTNDGPPSSAGRRARD